MYALRYAMRVASPPGCGPSESDRHARRGRGFSRRARHRPAHERGGPHDDQRPHDPPHRAPRVAWLSRVSFRSRPRRAVVRRRRLRRGHAGPAARSRDRPRRTLGDGPRGHPGHRRDGPHDRGPVGRALTSVPEHQQEALFAWVRSGSYVAEGEGDFPSLEAFEDVYEGEWCSWREYADHMLEEGGLLEGVSDEVRRYIDYDQWARDLLMDYTVEDAEDGGVIVFRNL